MKKNRVVITGMGVISPVGNSKDEFWASLLEGKSGAGILKALDPSHFSSHVAAEVKNFDPTPYINPKELRRIDKFIQYAICAGKMAVEDSKIDLESVDRNRFGVYIGSGIGGLHTIENALEAYLERGPEGTSGSHSAPGGRTPDGQRPEKNKRRERRP